MKNNILYKENPLWTLWLAECILYHHCTLLLISHKSTLFFLVVVKVFKMLFDWNMIWFQIYTILYFNEVYLTQGLAIIEENFEKWSLIPGLTRVQEMGGYPKTIWKFRQKINFCYLRNNSSKSQPPPPNFWKNYLFINNLVVW